MSSIAAIASDNGLTLDQMQASITSHGLSIEEYRAKIKSEIERSKVVNAMVNTPAEIVDKAKKAMTRRGTVKCKEFTDPKNCKSKKKKKRKKK